MKEKMKVALKVIVAVAFVIGAVLVWRVAYSTRKSNDNLPALTKIAEMSEAEVNNLLVGYRSGQLRAVWGEPNTDETGADSWKAGETTLTVNYRSGGVVESCSLGGESGAALGGE